MRNSIKAPNPAAESEPVEALLAGGNDLVDAPSAARDSSFAADAAPPRSDRDEISCPAVHGMFAVGARRLTVEALQDMAEHLEGCVACFELFEKLSGGWTDDAAESDQAPDASAVWASFLSRFVEQVVAESEGRHAPHLTVVRAPAIETARRVTLADWDGQLAPGQILTGKHHQFVVSRRIGCSDFIETYLAEVVAPRQDDETGLRQRGVIKIPRIVAEMSPATAIQRLGLLRRLIRAHVQDLENLAGLPAVAQMIDYGEYLHWFHGGSAESTFVVCAFVEGLELSEYMERRYGHAGHFRGLPTAATFAQWARMLTKGVLEIHNRRALHGDICPRNILVSEEHRPVFVDVGQSLFREVMNGAPMHSSNFYRAPEGISNPSSDLFSLGGLLFFLATGREPIGFLYTDREVLKQQIALQIKEANPALYQDDVGIADVIAACLRRDGRRVQHANLLLRDIDTFWPEGEPARVLDELSLLTATAAALDDQNRGNAVFRAVAVSHVRSLRQTFSDMCDGIFDASSDIRAAAYALLRTLGDGDEFVTVSIPAFWFSENIGINGRFLSMCRNAAARGASVKRVLLIKSDLADPDLEEIVAAQLNAAAELEPSQRENFAVRYLPITADQRRALVASGKHFGLLVKGGDRIAMFPVYDTEDRLVTLQFRSGARQVEGLRESFDSIWKQAKSLVDLRFPTRLDIIEKLGSTS